MMSATLRKGFVRYGLSQAQKNKHVCRQIHDEERGTRQFTKAFADIGIG